MSATRAEYPRTLAVALAVAVVIAGVLAYANTFINDFVWDDASSVLLHQHVQDPANIGQLFKEDQHAFGLGQGNFYRPLVSVSFMIDYQISTSFGAAEISPFVFHITNLMWHIAAALALFALLRVLMIAPWIAFATALLYIVHPLHTEAVAYISGRADPMAAAFMFTGLACACSARPSARGAFAGVAAIVCFVAALLCKESAAIFPVLLALVLVARHFTPRGATRSGWIVWGASLAVVGVYGWLRATVLDFGSDSTVTDTGLLARLNEVVQAFGAYVGLIFWPSNLHMERSLEGFGWLHSVAGVVLLACVLVGLAAAMVRRRPHIAFGLAWFLIGWLPISGLFPLNAPMAEHWMYVPLAGFLLALACSVDILLRRARVQWAGAAIAACAALVFTAMTLARNADWRNNETLFRATLEDNPRSTRVHYNLAVTYEDLLGNLPGARRHYERVLALYDERKTEADKNTIWDEELGAHLSLGTIYFEQGRYDLAARHYQMLASLQPNDSNRLTIASATLGLGKCMLAVGDPGAMQALQRAIELEPGLRPELAQVLRDAV